MGSSSMKTLRYAELGINIKHEKLLGDEALNVNGTHDVSSKRVLAVGTLL